MYYSYVIFSTRGGSGRLQYVGGPHRIKTSLSSFLTIPKFGFEFHRQAGGPGYVATFGVENPNMATSTHSVPRLKNSLRQPY